MQLEFLLQHLILVVGTQATEETLLLTDTLQLAVVAAQLVTLVLGLTNTLQIAEVPAEAVFAQQFSQQGPIQRGS